MSELTCRVCLVTFDGDEDLQSLFAEDAELQGNMAYKLQAIGFLQPDPDDGLPSLICGWCAARVVDAYELKQQCDDANASLQKTAETATVVENLPLDAVKTLISSACYAQSSQYTSNAPSSVSVTSKGFSSSMKSLMIAGIHDMITCVRDLSVALRFITNLITNAVEFADDIISLFLVLLPVKETTISMLKSAQAVREESACWKRKSDMFKDISSFLRVLQCTNFTSREISSVDCNISPEANQMSSIYSVPSPFPVVEQGTDLSVEQGEALPSRPMFSDEGKFPADSSSFDKQIQLEREYVSNCDLNLSLNDAYACSLRRSKRTKSVIDPLVYWPSFKKSKSSATGQKSEKTVGQTSTKSYQALDALLLKREVTVGSNSTEKEKWTLVKKKKMSERLKLDEKLDEANGNCSSSVQSLTLKKEHKKINGYPCHFCNKIYSSEWNRVQHERVHTGEKPYTCNVCQMAFRYNVSLRNHKMRLHFMV